MQINLVLRDKELAFAADSPCYWLVSDNDDYVLHFDMDEQRTVMFATFVRDGEAIKCTIDEDGYVLDSNSERKVPMWALADPVMTVGIESDGYATVWLEIPVRWSVKRLYDAEVVQPDDPVVDQLIRRINNGVGLPSVDENSEGQMLQVVNGEWVLVNPTSGMTLTTDETLTLNNNVLSVNTTNDASQDNTLPITSAGVNNIVGNINALLGTI